MGFFQILLQYIIQVLVKIFELFTNRQYNHVLNKMNYWQLSMENIEEARTLLTKVILNENQCRNLVSHLEGLKNISSIENDIHGNMLVGVKKDLYRITFNAKVLISECCKENWLPIAILQYNNREAFRELLMDMDSWFNTMCETLQQYYPNRDGNIEDIRNLTIFYPSSIDDVDGDLLALQKMIHRKRKRSRQANESQGGSFDMVEFNEAWIGSISHNKDILAHYMERRIIELRKSFGAEVNISIIPDNYPHPDNQAPLYLQTFTNVYESKWLGMNCVTKVFSIPMEASSKDAKEMIFKEARTMEGLCHPNIIKLYYCGYSDEGKKFMIVMEQGQMTLSKMLKKYKEEKKRLPEEVKLDIILQIASGMCYMHDMMIVHRDLKLENVVVNTIFPKEVGLEYVHVKLLDFGQSEVKRRNTSQVLVGNDEAGTSGYMAPEVFKTVQVKKVDAFKADVFSFSMMCSEILSLEKPFGESLRLREYRKEILAGRRPRLGEDCSPELTLLIKSCWSSDPNKRPSFHEILRLLTMMKKALFQGSLLATNVVKVYDKIVAPNILVGVESKIIMLEGILQNVGALGIVGMGGIGKSTLAKALSDRISHKFEATCYIDDFKHGSCRFMLREENDNSNLEPEVHSLEEGCDILRRVCTTKRSLIVLDDVELQSPLNALLENKLFDNLGGCKIIATSRSWKSLERLHIPLEGKFDLELLDNNQSLELFSIHASTENQYLSAYLKSIAEKIVRACNGLPLSLQVIGSQLRGELRLRKWEQTLFRLMQGSKDEVTEKQLWNILQISFDDLSDEEKDMFLDVSCLFCNDSYPSYIHEDDLILIANEDVSISKHSLHNLKDRSLLKIDEYGLVTIHDHLRNMGRRIAHEQQSHSRDQHMTTFDECNRQDPQKIKGLSFSRFGHYESHNKRMTSLGYNHLRILIFHLLEDFNFISELLSQTPSLGCLIIKFSNMDDASKIRSDIAQMLWRIFRYNTLRQVRVLYLDNCNFFEEFPDLLLDLIQLSSLHMINCNHREIHLFKFTNLISLRLKSCSRFCEFSGEQNKLPNHQILRSDECPTLKKISNISTLTQLKTLIIFECKALEEFPSGLENLVNLEVLDLSKCSKLKKGPTNFRNLMCLKRLRMYECEALEEFPHGLENLVALEVLSFSICRKLRKGPNTFGNLTRLKDLQMWECEALEEFPHGLENMVALEKLDFSKCRKLKKGPNTFGNLTHLRNLQMWECEGLEEFPHGLENLVALVELDFSKCRTLKKGPNTFGNLTRLKELQMWECEALEEFPYGLENLVALEELDFSKCRKLKKGPNTFGILTCLKQLRMQKCETLEEFPHGLVNLVALEELDFSKCRKLKKGPNTFGNLTHLRNLQMWECEALEEFPHGLENLVALEVLSFSICRKLKKGPNTFGNLTHLRNLQMWECEALEEFPHGLENLVALEEFNFSKCRKLKKGPNTFGNLTHLRNLQMWECEALEEFPHGLENLVALEVLSFSICRKLKKGPNTFGNLTHLRNLQMWECEALEEFPHGFENLVALEKLDFSKCRKLRKGPNTFGNLTRLKDLQMWECEALEEFPHGLENLVALEKLDFSKCRKLRKGPNTFGNLTRLRDLQMWECEALEEFPHGLENLVALEKLDFSKCRKLRKGPNTFGNLTRLKQLRMQECEALEEFPHGLENLVALEKLDYSKCSKLKEALDSFGNLACLKSLQTRECETLEKF